MELYQLLRKWDPIFRRLDSFRKDRYAFGARYSEQHSLQDAENAATDPTATSAGVSENLGLFEGTLYLPVVIKTIGDVDQFGLNAYVTSAPQTDYVYEHKLNRRLRDLVDAEEWARYVEAELSTAIRLAYRAAVRDALQNATSPNPVLAVYRIAKSVKDISDATDPRIYVVNSLSVV